MDVHPASLVQPLSDAIHIQTSRTKYLSCWKEIATYLGKAVRTVQRWEAERGLPVYRSGAAFSAVYAVPAEIDLWLRVNPAARLSNAELLVELEAARVETTELRRQVARNHETTPNPISMEHSKLRSA